MGFVRVMPGVVEGMIWSCTYLYISMKPLTKLLNSRSPAAA